MLKFNENEPVQEVSGFSSVTWVNSNHVCYGKENFKKILEENKSQYAFLCGSSALRNDEGMCIIAAKNGVSIDTLSRYGVLSENTIIQSLIASAKGISEVSYSSQIRNLMGTWVITPEFFGQVINTCPKGTSIAYDIMYSSNKNKQIKEIICNNKDKLLYCMERDPKFYEFANERLKNDFEVAYLAAKSGLNIGNYIGNNSPIVQDVERRLAQDLKVTKKTFYGIDGTIFATPEEAIEYNNSLSISNGKTR